MSSFKWGFIDNISYQVIHFVIGIVLARLLSPYEFGLVGMIAIVFAVSQSFIDSGFSQALVRKNDCTDEDYSTVFYFNLFAGIVFYLILFFAAPLISSFFNQPELVPIIRVMGINLIISSVSIIQGTIRTKRLDFKMQTKVSIIANSLSGAAGIGMAYFGYGVWSLVWQSVFRSLFSSALLWYWNNWLPKAMFNRKVLKELFPFGSKLILSGLIYTTYRNIYYLVIGKFFSPAELGYYTRAEGFNRLPSQNITAVFSRISYPLLSSINEDTETLKKGYKKLIKTATLLSFTLMIGMAASSEAMIISLVGEKWRPAVPYLQLMALSGMSYPLHSLNLNILKVRGRSDLFLKLEIIKILLGVPLILIGIWLGIIPMLIGILVASFISYYLNSLWSGVLINYGIKEQVSDIIPTLLISLIMGLVVYSLNFLVKLNPIPMLIVQTATGFLIAAVLSEIFRLEPYLELKKMIPIQKLKAIFAR
ncbi:MAG: lipopolysaccharide biosynthesis protein [Ignavibacteriaceae bacterium]|nr:lipopolysaccharide biosynthesis protein [Ignavibacteriaceae bacterium]